MPPQILELDGKLYVVLPRAEYDLLVAQAEAAELLLPPLPPADANGNVPASAYARASIAREIIIRRRGIGWTQQELADAAGIRGATVRRVETGRHTSSVPTIERIDRALNAAEEKKKRSASKRTQKK